MRTENPVPSIRRSNLMFWFKKTLPAWVFIVAVITGVTLLVQSCLRAEDRNLNAAREVCTAVGARLIRYDGDGQGHATCRVPNGVRIINLETGASRYIQSWVPTVRE